MFNSISWNEFIEVTATIVAGYYVITVLLLYHGEIMRVFQQKKLTVSVPQTFTKKPESSGTDHIMGNTQRERSSPSADTRLVRPEEIAIAPEDETLEAPRNGSNTLLVGAVADLLQEIEILVEAMAKLKKDEAITMVQTLLARYPQLVGTTYQDAIAAVIFNAVNQHCPFSFNLNQIRSWWPAEAMLSKR